MRKTSYYFRVSRQKNFDWGGFFGLFWGLERGKREARGCTEGRAECRSSVKVKEEKACECYRQHERIANSLSSER